MQFTDGTGTGTPHAARPGIRKRTRPPVFHKRCRKCRRVCFDKGNVKAKRDLRNLNSMFNGKAVVPEGVGE